MTDRSSTTTSTTLVRWVLVGMLAAALMLRAPITGVPPVLTTIAEELSFSPTVAGLASTLPLLCFGTFAFVTPFLTNRFGIEPTLWLAMVILTLGLAVRLFVDVGPFFIGTLLIGLGIAIGNVLVPALARTWFAERLALAMGLYSVCLQISGAAGPLATNWGGGAEHWPRAIGLWLVPGALVVVLWTALSFAIARTRRGQPHRSAAPTGLAAVVRRPLTWVITANMGLQSMLFYTLMTWLPTQFDQVGASAATIALMMSTLSLLGMPGSFIARWFTVEPGAPTRLVFAWAFYVVGLLLLCLGASWSVFVGATICGLGQGLALANALTFISNQADPADVPAVSALAQGVGYGIAAIGPVLFGFIYDRTGSLFIGEIILVGVALSVLVCSIHLAREVASREIRQV